MEEVPATQIRRHFLSWDRPLLPQAVTWLAGDWRGDGPLDLADRLVLVPTRQAGRRLREALAVHAAARNQAVFSPRVTLPEALLEVPASQSGPVASELEVHLAWMEAIRGVPLEEYRAVFPVDPPERSAAWARGLARTMARLQRLLGEVGLAMSDVPARAGAGFPEAERWRQLARLEALCVEDLAARGLRDPQAVRRAAARRPAVPAGARRLVLLALPDPLPVALRAVEALALAMPVDIVVHAPADEGDVFDRWGRPEVSAWTDRVIALPDFGNRVHLCADPAGQADRIAEAAANYRGRTDEVAIGSADAEVLGPLETALERAGVKAFNPEGRRLDRGRLHQLLAALARVSAEGTFAAAAALARCPDFLAYLQARLGDGFSAASFLAGLDDLHAAHLPGTLAEARRHRPREAGLRIVEEICARLQGGAFARTAAAVPAEIFAARRFATARDEDAFFVDEASAWMETVRACRDAAQRFGEAGLSLSEWWETALALHGGNLVYPDKPAGALELQGWLELAWEDAPHLLVAGLNDGRAPEAVAGDPFVPESLRERLGLKTNARRHARDAYVLTAMVASRARAGRVDLLLGRTSAAGDPLRPSRLLLRCPDASLPERVSRLFRPVEVAAAAPSWRRAWRLRPRRVPPPARVAVTALRAWLLCPFRFHLRHGLRMEEVDTEKAELDALDFGILCHAALEEMGRDSAMRDCTDERRLREFLLARIEAEAASRYGAFPPPPLIVQIESARQRLARAAAVQAAARAEGWVIERVEEKFTLAIGALTVVGKADRIERHEGTGELRIVDYKTSDRPVTPADAHLRRLGREEQVPEFALAGGAAEGLVWADLQLPLYLRAFAPGGVPATAAYFNLPKAAGETGILAWDGYTRELDASAWRCAEGVAAAIAAGEFWPPNENLSPDWDDFAPLFHHGVADSVAWEEGK